MADVNEQRARRQNFSDAKNSKSEDGQYADRSGGSELSANDGEKVSAPSFAPSETFNDAPHDGELIGSSSPEIGIVKGSDQPTAPSLEKGSGDVPDPEVPQTLKDRMP